MDLNISFNTTLDGHLSVPPSKSYSQRALALAFLIPKLRLRNLGNSDDEMAAKSILKSCGIEIIESDHETIILNSFDFNHDVEINCKESGLSARLFSALLLLNTGKNSIQGEGSLLKRPMYSFEKILNDLQIPYSSNKGKLPIVFNGKIAKPPDLEIDGTISSQFITGILYYLVGLSADKQLNIILKNPQSIPYIELTINILSKAGAKIKWKNKDIINVFPAKLKNEHSIDIEGDWSSAAFWIVYAAIAGRIELMNLNINSLQADRAIIEVIVKIGANIRIQAGRIEVRKDKLKSFNFDATHCPDLIPILCVLALFCDGKSEITGTHRLLHKESNRLEALKSELSKISNGISLGENKITITGKDLISYSKPIEFESYFDHRIAMSMAVLSSVTPSGGVIRNSDCVSKSYPTFFDDLNALKIGNFAE